MPVSIRTIRYGDWSAIMHIQAQCYHELVPEPLHILQQKVGLSPQTCWVAERGGQVLGYLLCHPWHYGPPPSLSCPIGEMTRDEIFYLHDLAIADEARGLGVGQRLVDTALDHAKEDGYDEVALIAVQDAPAYWRRHGFVATPTSKSLAEYGEDAEFMKLKLN
ncbi:GNAT family N-acetyltransferase [Aeromonas diversa]|nr:GNAT family N-acetyltransferase [Aeromonas diversa]